jgi:hypothetical protein
MPLIIDQSVMCDGEGPRAKPTLVPLKAREIAHKLQKDLSGQVFGVARASRAKVAEHRRREISVDRFPRPIASGAGAAQDFIEVLSEGHGGALEKASAARERSRLVRKQQTIGAPAGWIARTENPGVPREGWMGLLLSSVRAAAGVTGPGAA